MFMKCPKCNDEMEKVKWDIGFGILVDSNHCPKCKFNITNEKKLDKAMAQLRERMTFERKVIRVGVGLGIRFPNELVEEYNLKYGKTVRISPEKDRIIMEMRY